MDVFSAFPKAIVGRIWRLGKLERSTEEGVRFVSLGFKDVIVDEAVDGSSNTSPQAGELESDTLLYAKPNQLPTTDPAAFISDYLWEDTESGQFYSIIDVGVGKNQELGVVEHIEFRLRQTEVVDE